MVVEQLNSQNPNNNNTYTCTSKRIKKIIPKLITLLRKWKVSHRLGERCARHTSNQRTCICLEILKRNQFKMERQTSQFYKWEKRFE